MDHYIKIISLMVVAGLLGGITNFFRVEEEKRDWFLFLKNVLMGVSASLLIPLFLNMISSNLLTESASDSLKLLVFFGFCLIAALSSKAFIQTISDRVLNKLKETDKKLEDIRENVEPIISKETEAQETEETSSFLKVGAFSFGEDDKKVLKSLGGSKYAWRSVSGVAKETGLPKEKVLNFLDWLLSNDLAVRTREKGRWGLTSKGRQVFVEMTTLENIKQKGKES